MRKLQTSDIFAACRMINKIGIRDEIKNLFLKANLSKEINRDEAGLDFILNIFEKATGNTGEKEVYKFLSGLIECTPEEVAQLDPVECMDKIMAIADIEKWKAFFLRVASLMKLN